MVKKFRPVHITQIPFSMAHHGTNTYLGGTFRGDTPAGNDKGNTNSITPRLILRATPQIRQFVYCPYTFFVLVSSVAAIPASRISPVPFFLF